MSCSEEPELHLLQSKAIISETEVEDHISKMTYWSDRVRAPSASFRHDGTTIIIDFFSSFFFSSAALTVLPERVVVGF